MILEVFDAVCTDCPSYISQVYYRDTIYSILREILGHKGGYRVSSEKVPFYSQFVNLDYEAANSEIVEVVSQVKKGGEWRSNPLQYGTEDCSDGSHSVVTVIFPDEKIESLYVRCWTSKKFRSQK